MKKILMAVYAVMIGTLLFATPASAAWIKIEDEGNTADPLTGYGSVADDYYISSTEVTNAQYAEFLNAIAASDPNGVWNINMDIIRSGSDGTYTYAPIDGYEQRAVLQATYFDAMRYVNWLQNGQPTGVQDLTTTEDGTYFITDGFSETRASDAIIALPTEDEWYKAAYYDPDTMTYSLYPTQSNTAPTAESPIGGANSANYDNLGGADTTTVGAYSGTTSYYGGYDFGGNAFEWTEGVEGTDRIIRGGSYASGSSTLLSTSRTAVDPGGGSFTGGFGFRIMIVPEPSSVFMLAIGSLGLMLRRKRN